MYTINHKFSETCIAADGRYLNASEIQSLEKYISTYKGRLNAYQSLHTNSNQIVLGSLKKLAKKYPDLIRSKGKRCHYDMTTTLRYMALSVLRDDETFFQDSVVIWLDSVLVAHQKHHHCAEAYRYLLEEMSQQLSGSALNFVRPYTDSIIQLFESHVN
ncbi:phycobilisome protein [Okeania sp. SIO2G5]|uniref:phycobilisome protein n=1 Tax=Okeania sp. SIO2G5 TaxID=2607796 RepID=UPI00338E723D